MKILLLCYLAVCTYAGVMMWALYTHPYWAVGGLAACVVVGGVLIKGVR